MKRVLSIALLAGCSSPVLAADFGVGVSVQSNDAWIYAPIDITPALRIEPSIRFVSAESESQTQSSSFGLPITTSVKSDTDQRQDLDAESSDSRSERVSCPDCKGQDHPAEDQAHCAFELLLSPRATYRAVSHVAAHTATINAAAAPETHTVA